MDWLEPFDIEIPARLSEAVGGHPLVAQALARRGLVDPTAARAFLGAGASVYVLDHDLARLQRLDEMMQNGSLVTMVSHAFNIRKVAQFADVLVGAVLVPGARAPILVTRDVLRSMKPRSIILDLSIDQGGCVETSRPTTHRDPTFVEENIIHYCVPNMTSVVARTATHALNVAAWPSMSAIADKGLDAALAGSAALRRGVATRGGQLVNPALAASMKAQEAAR